jgi:hypothetical protein
MLMQIPAFHFSNNKEKQDYSDLIDNESQTREAIVEKKSNQQSEALTETKIESTLPDKIIDKLHEIEGEWDE